MEPGATQGLVRGGLLLRARPRRRFRGEPPGRTRPFFPQAALALLLIFGLLVAGPFVARAGAQAAPAHLRVEGEASYDPTSRWLTATQVRLQQGPLTVESDTLEADLATQQAVFTGNVRLETEGGLWEGEQLTYDLESGAYTLGAGTAAVELPGAQGLLRLRVPAAEGTQAHIHLSGASLTTCSLEEPEYHVRSRSIVIEPGVRMVLRHVVYVEGSIPIFYWPQMTISLDPEEDVGTSPFQPPEVGWTEEDGWYLRASYYYDTRADRLGALHMGYYQFSGLGLGVTQQVPLGPASLTVGVDWLQNPPSEVRGRTVAEPRYRLQTRIHLPDDPDAPVQASYEVTYSELRPAPEHARGDWSLEHDLAVTATAGDTSVTLDAHQERGLEEGRSTRREAADVTARQKLGPFTLKAGAQGRRWETGTGLEEHLGYQGELVTGWGAWDAALRGGWTLHPNLLKYRNDGAWTRFGRSPEAELGYTLPATLWPSPLQGTRVRLSVQEGRYKEEQSNSSTTWTGATHLEARSSGTRIPLGAGFALGAGAWGGGWGYGDVLGQQLTYAGSSWTLQYRPGGPFTGELGYTIQRGWGTSPFESHEASWSDRERAELVLEADLQRLRAGAYASYNLMNQEVEDLVGLVELRLSERLEVGAAGRYDVGTESWTRYDGRMAIGLSENWWLEGQAAYTFDPDEGTTPLRGQVSLSYTSDCRSIGFRFDLVDRAFWLEYRLNAFPSAVLQFGQKEPEPSLLDLPDMKAVAREVTS